MKNTQFKVEDVFGDITGKDKTSQDEIIKFSNFLAKMKWKKIYMSISGLLHPEKKYYDVQPFAPPEYSNF